MLTEREKEIVELIREGLSSQEVADRLFISFHTVVTHRRNIMKKLGVKNTVQMLIKSL
jgi:DNA-binding CsgD family transcriptional regulator